MVSQSDANATARTEVAKLNERRARDGLPVTDMYLGLHVGGMLYGNVGSTEPFTVVGRPSTRPAGSPPVEQPVLVSEAFANVDGMRGRLVSVGRYALRSVAQLFSWIPPKPVSSLLRSNVY